MYKIYRINGVGVKSDAVFCHRKYQKMTGRHSSACAETEKIV